MTDRSTIFALDIGTRSVVGIILAEDENGYEVLDVIVKEHEERAMLDGQIHDVLAVAKVIKYIKTKLEAIHGPLTKVCVAAAGRALKTERGSLQATITGKNMLSKDDVLFFELGAVQQAQIALAEKGNVEKSHNYYCVGYSVIHYHLDGQEMGSLIDQQGDELEVEVIATFLPRVVVESLIAALARADLEMEALTLEPIAAINVLIPSTMRRLNVALVDIGAGTSDIAITDLGTIINYGMVPFAGDEITETISDHYLLDFPLAEKAKRDLSVSDTIEITDILGFITEVPREEIIEKINPAVDKLASSIAHEILELNFKKPPKAVMLVGGGSLTPDLPKRIATLLNLPDNRVAIRGIEAIQKLTMGEQFPRGPEFVTPIGIAIASKQSPVHYMSIRVNEQIIRLFDLKQLTVGDCLLAAGIQLRKLYGKPGMAKIVTMNGQTLTLPGSYGEPPTLLVNGEKATLDTAIHDSDAITVERGIDGTPAAVTIGELVEAAPEKLVMINGSIYTVKSQFYRNGQLSDTSALIEDRDELTTRFPTTVHDLFESLHLHDLIAELRPFTVTINEQATPFPTLSPKLYVNQHEVELSAPFEHNDNIVIQQQTKPTVADLLRLQELTMAYSIPIRYNGQIIQMSKDGSVVMRDGKELAYEDVIYNGDKLIVEAKKVEPFIFQDIFRYIDVEIPVPGSGRTFSMLKNGAQTSFQDVLAPGDEITIKWEQKQGEPV